MNRIIFLPASSETSARLSPADFQKLGICITSTNPFLPDHNPKDHQAVILCGSHSNSKRTADIVSMVFEISKDPKVQFDESDKPTFSDWCDQLTRFGVVKVVLVIIQHGHMRRFAEYTAQRLLRDDELRIHGDIRTDQIIVLDPERPGVVI